MFKSLSLEKITLYGLFTCLFLPVLEVKYRYLNGYNVDNQILLFEDVWCILMNNWDGEILLFGFRPELSIIPFALIIQLLIVLKHQSKFRALGFFFDSWLTYLFILVFSVFNLYFVIRAYAHHHIEFHFWIGGYFFLFLILMNLIIGLREKQSRHK